MYLPVVVLFRAAHVGEFPALAAQEGYVLEILGAVIRAHVEALGRSPYEFALVVGSFQVCCDRCLPLLGGDGRKQAKQLFFLIICHNKNELFEKLSSCTKFGKDPQSYCFFINNVEKGRLFWQKRPSEPVLSEEKM